VVEPSDSGSGGLQDVADLRGQLGHALQDRAGTIVRETTAVCLFAGMERVAAEDRTALVALIFELLTAALRDGSLDSRTTAVTELGQLVTDRGIGVRGIFNLVYLMERTALDQLSADDTIEALAQSWTVVSQAVRRASFDVCATFTEYLSREMVPAAIVDPLTTLHTRSVFVGALEKEIHRAERFAHPFAVILFDVDKLGEINASHGYGAGDRILERIGITIRNYFRDTDWVARTAGDAFAVLLPEIQRVHAERLADRVRTIIRERLQLHDHRSNTGFPVTVSAGVLVAESVDKSVTADHMMVKVKDAVDLAKQAGRNRIHGATVTIDRSVTPTRAGISMD
jgi:diguanylate cyclase (GGDEF)-like protein